MKKAKLSVVLATKNEGSNIGACLQSVKDIADENIVFDEFSNDKTREIAKGFGARVFKYRHKKNFHETKQRAINRATGDWILQLDADERVTPKLAKEIKSVIEMDLNVSRHPEYIKGGIILPSTISHLPSTIKLYSRHQHLIKYREGKLGKKTGNVVAFFIPRINYFLGAPLRHAGVYPDGVIRLFRRGKARLPGRSVHELMEVDGEVAWLGSDLEHHESPTFSRYFKRANRYTDLTAEEFKVKKVPANPLFIIHYSIFKPVFTFMKLYFRHRGYKDGFRGFVWSLFSALHFPIAYFKYYQSVKK